MSKRILALAAVLCALSPVAHAQSTVPISQLPNAALPLAGSELLPCVQGGITKNCLQKNVAANAQGTVAADNAAAGIVGEFQMNSAQGVSMTSSTNANITSITLTPGDWEVKGEISTSPGGGTTTIAATAGVSTTSTTFATYATGVNAVGQLTGISIVGQINVPAPSLRVNVSTSTTVYLVASSAFSGGTLSMSGYIQARRIR